MIDIRNLVSVYKGRPKPKIKIQFKYYQKKNFSLREINFSYKENFINFHL
ncbi:hypothetical protein ADICYQ_1587 [Cyclobacterium qasimii M12-11B]|uniref:Uncharacterized protein n=1 Tax=Cyclobacterium qasimii M12-11B TaxID=641524 RepID=S7VIJ6_9BACT|nr:hypothetical protein ADICYQ_1587 [Cyclobacterium qasimii M12-11B]